MFKVKVGKRLIKLNVELMQVDKNFVKVSRTLSFLCNLIEILRLKKEKEKKENFSRNLVYIGS
jgi:hypothetical protein